MGVYSKVADLIDPPKKKPKWPTPLDMAERLDPSTRRVEALEIINEALVEAFKTEGSRLIISMPPQQGKSQLAVRRFVTWMLSQRDDMNIVVASYEHNVARVWGRTIRDDVISHADTLKLKIRSDVSAQNEWQIDNGKDTGGLFVTGIGGALTSRQAHAMIIDDPVKDAASASSKKVREFTWQWWDQVAQTRLTPGAPVIVIMTRWHQDDLAGRLIARHKDEWKVINIPAEAEEGAEWDILGRKAGEFMQSVQVKSAVRDIDNDEWWRSRKKATSPLTWAAMYQGHPSPEEGGVFPKTDAWARWTSTPYIVREDGSHYIPELARSDMELVQSWDLAFKDKKDSDFVVGQVWLRWGNKAYLLDQVRERMNFNQSLMAVKAMTQKWPQAIAKFIEDKANGPALINALESSVFGLIPIEPEGSKYARASAVSPLVWSGHVVVPDLDATGLTWVSTFLSEAVDFPNAANDDTIDAFSQAVNRLLLLRIDNDFEDSPEDQELLEEQGYVYSIV